MSGGAAADRPLEGIRVVDFTSLVAGPWCTRLLADCGAEVIKVEAVGDGDVLRYAPPMADGASRVYAHFNCGKQSIALDLKNAAGLELARQLIAKADIVVENYRPGVMARLGLDYGSLSAIHERLIYCSVSGFGQEGPRSAQGAYAPVVHALSGFDHVFMKAQGDGETPPISCIMVADVVAAAYAFGAIQTALVHRERHGRGSFIDATLIESMMSLVAIQYQETQSEKPITSTRFRPIAVRNGHVVVPLVSMRNYMALFELIGRPEWKTEFATLALTTRNRDVINAELGNWAAPMTLDEVEAAMNAAGIPISRYATPKDMLSDAHMRARGSFAPMSDSLGDFVVLNTPFRMTGGTIAAQPRVARRGEDKAAIMSRVLGFDQGEIDQRNNAGAFG